MKKIHIIGGGPTGLFIAKLCGDLSINCEIYEKNSYIGGHHYINEHDNTMHSPRVIGGTQYNFLKLINSCNFDVKKKPAHIYRNTRSYLSFSPLDLIKVWILLFIYYPIAYDTLSKTRFKDIIKYFSKETENYMLHINTFIAAESKNSPANKIFCGFMSYTLMFLDTFENKKKYLIEIDNHWIEGLENYIKSKNIKINKSCKVTDLIVKNNRIISFKQNNNQINIGSHDEIVMAMDPQGIVKLLKGSQSELKNNWGDFNEFKTKLEMNTYKSIGFTIYTNKTDSRTKYWEGTEPTKNNITLYYHNDGIYFASICDLDKIHNGKKLENIHPIDLKKIIHDDIINSYPELKIHDIKIHNDAWFDGNKWECSHTACALDAHVGLLNPKGNIDNIQFRNSLTEGRTYMISTLETCSEAAIDYINSLDTKKKIPHFIHRYDTPLQRLVFLSIGLGIPLITLIILYKILRKITK